MTPPAAAREPMTTAHADQADGVKSGLSAVLDAVQKGVGARP
jgi:hypothetical protein